MSPFFRLLFALGLLSLTVVVGAQDQSVPVQTPPPAQSPIPTQTPTPPAVSFVDPTVRLLAASQDGNGEISLKSATPLATAPIITDVPLPNPPAATVKFEPVDETKASNIWRYRVIVTGLTPASTAQQRYAAITVGGAKPQTFPYLLTNQVAGTFAWGISKLPDPWVASSWDGVCTPFTVTPKDSPATGVRIYSTLVEQSTKTAISTDKLKLYLVNDGDAGKRIPAPFDLPANVTSQLQICTTDGFHGNFHGLVTLAAVQKPDGESILQNAMFSSFWAKLGGFALIILGVYLAWLAKVWSRSRLERNQALIPALLMRSRLEEVKGSLQTVHPDYRDLPVNIKHSIQTLLADLSDNTLDQNQFIAPRFPNPFGATTNSVGYKTYLEERNPKIQLLSLLKDGIERAAAADDGTLTAVQKGFVKTAIQQIDQISQASPQPSLVDAGNLVEGIIGKMKTAITGVTPAPQNLTPAAREFEVVQLQIQAISKWIWLIYGGLTALSGLAVLILNNPGFGIPLDFIFAFFWGFGLPTTIAALAPGSVATALNVSVART
jgi:hypothetical protein